MKRKLFLVLFLTAFSALCGNAQTSWERLFSRSSDDVFRSVIEVPTGGYIAAGYTADFTSTDTDAYAVRLTATGDTMWTFRYNGPLSKKDLFYKVIYTIDSGFTFCGYSTSFSGLLDDAFFLKLNANGQLQWAKSWGGNGKERAQDIVQTADGKYTVCGYTTTAPAQYYDAFLLRLTSTGDSIWSKRYGGIMYDDANSIQILADGGYIIGGQSNSDQFLVRTNANGDTLWTKRNDSPQHGNDNIECIRTLPDGFIMVGSTSDSTYGDNGYLVKTDTGGTVLWTRSYGSRFPDDFHHVESIPGGGFFCTGTTSSVPGDSVPNMWVMRTNSNGDSLWSRAYGGAGHHDHGYCGKPTSDGGYVVAGFSSSFGYNYDDAYIVKADSSGNISNHLVYSTVFTVISPTGTMCGGPNTQVTVVLKNFGDATLSNIPVTIQITGSLTTTLNQTWPNPVAPYEWDTLTFTTTINTSGGGTYNFHCFTNNNNNVYPARNSFDTTLILDGNSGPPSITNNSRCGNGTVNLSASSASTIYWFAAASGGSPINTGPTFTTPGLSSTTTYYVQTGLLCASSRVPITATINSISPDPVTTNSSHCGSASVVLTATDIDPVTWYTSPTGGSPFFSGNSYTTPVLTTTTNYYVQASNGACTSNRVIITATISSVAVDPVTTSGQHCGTGSVTLTAASSDPVFWYDAPTGGTQVGNGNSFLTPLISSTTTYYAEANNGCVSNRVPATATINPLAADPVATPGENCGPGSITLGATASNFLIWYDALSGGNQVGTGTTYTTPMLSSTTTYYVQANNGICPSNRIAVTATIHTLPNVNLGNDTSIIAASYTLNAGAGFSTYLWSNGQTTQTISISSPDTFCVTVTDANGCTGSDCIIVDISLGISDINSNKLFSVYPNPSSGIITIEFKRPSSTAVIEILNMTGELIRYMNADHSESVKTDLSSFSKGIYLIRIISGDKSEIQKISVQ